MDKETRGRIEKDLDEVLKLDIRITEMTDWLLDALPIVRSREELVLGYLFGFLDRQYAHTVKIMKIKKKRKVVEPSKKDREEIRNMLRLRIQDFMERVNRELGS